MSRTEISRPHALSHPSGSHGRPDIDPVPFASAAPAFAVDELEGLLELVMKSAAAMVGTPNAYLYLHAPDEDALEARYCSGSFAGLEGYRLRPGEGVGGRVWQSGEMLFIEDYDTWEGRAAGYPLGVVRASLCVPLKLGQEVVGVIGLGLNDPERSFSPDDIDRLERYAALASVTLEHAQLRLEAQAEVLERRRVERELRRSEGRSRELFATADRQSRELALLERVAVEISRHIDLEPIIATVVQATAETFGYALVSVYMIENDDLVLHHEIGYAQTISSVPLASDAVIARVARSGSPILLEDVSRDPRFLAACEGIRSEVCVPLFDDATVVGVLNVETMTGDSLSGDDLRVLSALSGRVSVAVTRARLHAEARTNERRYRDVIEALKEGLFQTDLEGRLVFLNQAWAINTGHALEDSLGRQLEDFLHPEDREACFEACAQLLDGRIPELRTTPRYERADGSLGWLDIDAWALHDESGQIIGLAGTLLDRTAELEANRALALSEAQARTIIDTVDAVLWEAEAATGRNLYNSPQVERLLGYPVRDWLEQENFWIDHVHPDDREAASNAWTAAVQERRGARSEYRMIASDGRVVWFRDVSSFVAEPGQPERFRGVMLDITEEKRVEVALENDRLAYKNLIESVNGVFWESYAELPGYTFLSPQVELMLGFPRALWLNDMRFWEQQLHPDDRVRVLEMARCWDQFGDGWQADYRMIAANGQTLWVRDVVTVVREPGEPPKLRGVRTDITQERNAEALERDRSAVLEMIARDEALEVVLGVLASMLERQFTGAFSMISVREGEHLRLLAAPGAPLAARELFHPNGLELIVGDSALQPFQTDVVVIEDLLEGTRWVHFAELAGRLAVRACWSVPMKTASGENLGVVGLCFSQACTPQPHEMERLERIAQLTALAIERDKLTHRLTHQANYDALTGLANRAQFERWLERALIEARSGSKAVGVVFLDLDGFKHYNDSFGHAFGDALLKCVAERLNGPRGAPGMVARFGGDEFAAVLELRSPEDLLARARALLETLHEPLALDGREFFITASAGVAMYPEAGLDATTLQSNADAALYQVKSCGKNGVQVFTSAMTGMAAERLELDGALRRALERNEFEVHYQPQVDTQGRIAALEALLRWHRPGVGAISPATFIPLAEESGLIVPIDTWVLNEVCRQLVEWRRAKFAIVPCAVNVTALQIIRPDFLQTVSDALERHGLEAHYLELELTEGVFTRDLELVADRIRALRALGVRVAIDDFGTGYSSLSYLKDLPVDCLKVDRSFTRELQHGMGERSLVPAIVSIARQLKLEIVAEGVESELQADLLRQLGCDRFQGFLFGFPCPSAAIEARLPRVRLEPAHSPELQDFLP